jgi:hypothetical protein
MAWNTGRVIWTNGLKALRSATFASLSYTAQISISLGKVVPNVRRNFTPLAW